MRAAWLACANSRTCEMCDNCASSDTLRISLTVPHSPNPPHLVNHSLPSAP
ncbi:uncharacterized protein SCHCODRAFT_02586825 [Schizophyllum commune H4-8]|uniref:uncharacterized protein n=1 Tax=Schizophyllum commune (strain H4-8 / FGSC 9210) TaxID=578458 RepID=UPI00215FC577|nr:uncharacterized protein SCHCODRAFT_02586825 [Schizophyllum commune H4-8]KAI5888127.1 hypothetical protein SCHCODRAFT_02586825 [Schizophyllum commune H4-8]